MLFLKTVPPVLCSILRYIVLDYVQRGQLFTRIYILSIYEKDRFKKKICLVFSYPYSYILWKEWRTVLCFYVAKRCSGYRHIKLQQFLAWERNIPHTQTHAKKMLIRVWPECVYPGAQCAMMVKWMTEKNIIFFKKT